MRTINRRIRTLEDPIAPGEPPHLAVVCRAESEGFLDTDRCIQILGDCGFLPTGPGFAVVDRLDVPDGLNDRELERFLRDMALKLAACSPGHKTERARSVPIMPLNGRS